MMRGWHAPFIGGGGGGHMRNFRFMVACLNWGEEVTPVVSVHNGATWRRFANKALKVVLDFSDCV